MHDPGYGVFERVFDAGELVPVAAALDGHLATRSRAGARHVLALPAVRALAEDPRLLQLAEAFVGAARPFRATLFDKSQTANWLVAWHQDTALPMQVQVDAPGWGPWSTKAGVHYAHAPAAALATVIALRLSLDDSTADNGPLRVLPDTHALGLLDQPTIDELARTVRPVACTSSTQPRPPSAPPCISTSADPIAVPALSSDHTSDQSSDVSSDDTSDETSDEISDDTSDDSSDETSDVVRASGRGRRGSRGRGPGGRGSPGSAR